MRHGRTDGSFNVAERLSAGASLSGGEHNHLFLNDRGRAFVELSGVSGADSRGDGRSFALLDFDADGWQDMAVVNANAPLLQLFRNRMGERTNGRMLAVRLVGGNSTTQPTNEWSARDGYGALVSLDLDPGQIVREHRAGAGFSAQNSPIIRIGLGERNQVTVLRVLWPSGKIQSAGEVAAGSLVTVYENPQQSPTGDAFVIAPYVRE